MPKTVTISIDCPQCKSRQVKKLNERDRWDKDRQIYLEGGRFECLSCGHKFNYTYGIKEE